jgi:hypothetical protein
MLGDASGAVADLGVMIPLVAALVVKNGLDAATALACVGALYVAAGAYFRVPVPVQPIKAAAAIAIARGLAPSTLSSAGVVLGVVLVLLGATGAAKQLMRVFAPPIVRGIQLGLGLILVRAGIRLADPSGDATTYAVAIGFAIVLLVSARAAERKPVPLLIVIGGMAYSLIATNASVPLRVSLWDPHFTAKAFDPGVLWTAFVVLVIPQVPLTFGNAVVALADLEHEYFGERGKRVTPSSVSLSSGLANVVAGSLGGMPMCHGSGGLTAHFQAGASTNRMNFMIGGAFLVLGVLLGSTALHLLALIPLTVLMGFLMFTGVLHGALVLDRRGYELAVSVAMGVAGLLTANLAIALAVGLVTYWPVRFATRATDRSR